MAENKVKQNKRWIYEKYAIDCGRLNLAELGLYLLLLNRCDTREDYGYAKITLKGLAEQTQMESETLKAILKRLVNKQFIVKVNEKDEYFTRIYFNTTDDMMMIFGDPTTFPIYNDHYKPKFNYSVE